MVDSIEKKEQENLPEKAGRKRLLHPLSAVLTIVVDITFFGADAATLGLDLPVSVVLAALITLTGSFLIQFYVEKEKLGISLTKAFFLGVLAGVPFPIAGTGAGTFVLGISGIKAIRRKKIPGSA